MECSVHILRLPWLGLLPLLYNLQPYGLRKKSSTSEKNFIYGFIHLQAKKCLRDRIYNPSKSKASFQYLWVRKVHKKILRLCFLTSLGDFGPQSWLISLNCQFFSKQHREVNNTTLLHIIILWIQILHENFRNWLDRVIFGHFGPKLGQNWPKIGPK